MGAQVCSGSRVSGIGLAAMDRPLEEFDDHVLTDAQAAKLCGVALSGWLELKRDQPPLSMWKSDLVRYSRTLVAGEPGRKRLRR